MVGSFNEKDVLTVIEAVRVTKTTVTTDNGNAIIDSDAGALVGGAFNTGLFVFSTKTFVILRFGDGKGGGFVIVSDHESVTNRAFVVGLVGCDSRNGILTFIEIYGDGEATI